MNKYPSSNKIVEIIKKKYEILHEHDSLCGGGIHHRELAVLEEILDAIVYCNDKYNNRRKGSAEKVVFDNFLKKMKRERTNNVGI